MPSTEESQEWEEEEEEEEEEEGEEEVEGYSYVSEGRYAPLCSQLVSYGIKVWVTPNSGYREQ